MAIDFGRATTHERRVLYRGSIGEFGEDRLELPDGRQLTLAVLHHPGAAAVVPFLDAQTVVLLRQYRYAARATLWEVPAGKLDRGEQPELCAARELEEETGYVARRLTRLGRILTTPGFTNEVIHLFRADELHAGVQALEADESLHPVPVKLDEALAMIDRGEIVDAKSVCALLHAARAR
jgi:ADP-ribose pyrophosphatase